MPRYFVPPYRLLAVCLFLALATLTGCKEKKNYSTHIDKKTGLTWQRCPAGTRGKECSQGLARIYDWQEARDYCRGLKLAGKKWRLPNIRELFQLRRCPGPETVDNPVMSAASCRRQLPKRFPVKKLCSRLSEICKFEGTQSINLPVVDRAVFPGNLPAGYWTDNESRANKDKAWGISFRQGEVQTTNKDHRLYVRCVTP